MLSETLRFDIYYRYFWHTTLGQVLTAVKISLQTVQPAADGPLGRSDDPRQMEDDNDHAHRRRLDHGDGEDGAVGLPVRQPSDGEQGDDGPVVRQRVHPPAGHRSHPVAHF